jgi:hypothetical protein
MPELVLFSSILTMLPELMSDHRVHIVLLRLVVSQPHYFETKSTASR